MTNHPTKTLLNGDVFDVFDPDPNQIDIEYIAFVLAGINRFGGDARPFYSVGQHCVNCYRYLKYYYPNDYRLQMSGLLHDAPEAYLQDVITPLKKYLYFRVGEKFYHFEYIEDLVANAIYKKLKFNPIVEGFKEADVALGLAECDRNTKRKNGWTTSVLTQPIPNTCDFDFWSPEKTEAIYLNVFKKLKRLI